MSKWVCSQCGKEHDGALRSFGYVAPWPFHTLPEGERARRSYLDADYCVIEDEDFFVRGCLEIPVLGESEPLSWGVWASLSRANFQRERMLADHPDRVQEPPYFGWLSSRILIYPDTFALKTKVRTRQVGLRPLIELEPMDHPLSVEQREGITKDRLREIIEQMQHRWVHPDWDLRDR